jgi:hypothetical protein
VERLHHFVGVGCDNPPPDSIEFRYGKICLLSINFWIGDCLDR